MNSRTKVAIATLVGTTIEWYDFYIYGTAAALIFGKQFFPNLSPVMGTLAAFATFGVGFVARPLGGIVFGHIGDRFGRKGALVATLVIMGVCTFAIGLIPNYNSIGILAPVLLVVMRLIQGVAIGGEWGGAVLMATEHAPPGRRGIYAAWPQMGSGAGLLLANGVFLLTRLNMSDASFLEWGWRIPFWSSIVLVIIGLLIRMQVEESPVFKKMQETGKTQKMPLWHVVKTAPKALLLTACVFLLNNTAFYIASAFALAYLAKLGVPSNVGLTGVMIGAVMLCIFTIVFSYMSDFYGRKRIIASVYSMWFIMAFLFFFLLSTKEPMLIYLGFALATMLTAAYGPIGSFVPEQFQSDVRYTGVSISIQLASIIAGGTAPMIATMLNATYGIWAVSGYMLVIAIISVGAVLALPETSKADVDESVIGRSVGS
jgi:MHS family shikimate/dehydroshikimate transporter-like MFS transporter